MVSVSLSVNVLVEVLDGPSLRTDVNLLILLNFNFVEFVNLLNLL